MTHAFLRISGYGITVVPRAPFAIQANADGRLSFTVPDPRGERTVTVDPTCRSPADAGEDAHGVGEVIDGPTDQHWLLHVGGVYVATWPISLVLKSWPEPEQPPFFMLADGNGAFIYVQGPFAPGTAPKPHQMVGEGQRQIQGGDDGCVQWIELEYQHHEQPWRQRHCTVPLDNGVTAVVSGQAVAAEGAAMGRNAIAFARSLRGPSQ